MTSHFSHYTLTCSFNLHETDLAFQMSFISSFHKVCYQSIALTLEMWKIFRIGLKVGTCTQTFLTKFVNYKHYQSDFEITA